VKVLVAVICRRFRPELPAQTPLDLPANRKLPENKEEQRFGLDHSLGASV